MKLSCPAISTAMSRRLRVVQELTRHADAIVVVGSGSLSDTCKFATFKDGRKYASFGTASSMNGYAASTASVTLEQWLQDFAAGPCAARHFHRPEGLVRTRRPGFPPQASATACAGRRRRSIGGPRIACSSTFYSATPYALHGG